MRLTVKNINISIMSVAIFTNNKQLRAKAIAGTPALFLRPSLIGWHMTSVHTQTLAGTKGLTPPTISLIGCEKGRGVAPHQQSAKLPYSRLPCLWVTLSQCEKSKADFPQKT
uniref:Uncharacterized protein n=1 Tax=Anguilla anguilla TaxID=7936 RepID=A0A0E9WX94_ANGAN